MKERSNFCTPKLAAGLASRLAMLCAALLAGPALAQTPPADAASAPKPATEATRSANRTAAQGLPMQDQRAFDDARRGLIEPFGTAPVMHAGGARPAWSLKGYEFLGNEAAPDSVNPALWRHARINMAAGLFKVTERLYQVRGLDLSNMTIIEGDSGLIVIDPLTAVETAQAALQLYFKHRPRRPVVAVIYTHSHVDHFGGVRGVVDAANVAAGKVKVIAPAGFMEEAVGENVIAGPAMSRRALFQFGMLLPRGERGQVDAGLGKSVPLGTVSLIAPTQLIAQPVERHRVDGIDIVFELTPGAEAPAEMIMHYPQLRVLNMAEIATQNFHNLLPLRGAQVRNPLDWSKYIGAALQHHAAATDVLIAQHHWPVWGQAEVQTFLEQQRDAYKYVHDQTVRLMNQGLTGADIAEQLQLPPSLSGTWSTHGFYGDLKNNVKAIYQRYLGYYDGNPANLHALPPVAAARKAVAYMGGAAAVLERARADFAKGEYRWVAQVCSQLVFADPANQEARQLGADALEQLGYQVESATARNAFLQGALELRHGVPRVPPTNTGAPDVVRAIPLDLFFDYLGVRLDGEKAQGKTMVLNWNFTDTGQRFILTLENSALTHVSDAQAAQADATLTLTRSTLDQITLQRTTFPQAIQSGDVRVSGSLGKLAELFALLDPAATTMFPVVEPSEAARRRAP